MKSKYQHLFFLSVLTVSLASQLIEAAPTLTGTVYNATTIFWTWTGATPGATLTLEDASGTPITTYSADSSGQLEGSLTANTVYQRKIADSGNSSTSALVTIATPDSSAAVSLGFPATLVASDNLTRVAVSQGALPGNGQVSVSLAPATNPLLTTTQALLSSANAQIATGLITITGSAREFTAISNGNPYSSTFAAPVTIQLPYADANGDGYVDGISPAVPVATLGLYTIDTASQRWTAVPGASLDTTNKILTANVSHFSIYALFGVNASATLAALKVFPSPWRPGSGGAFDDSPGKHGIHFQNLTPIATIKIFTVTGHLVRKLEKQISDGNEMIWDGLAGDGDKAASGVYLYLVTAPNVDKQTGRFAIIR